jgi:hypothetical protein
MKRLIGFSLGLLIMVPTALADEPAPDKTGLGIGQKAPEFTLKDQEGEERSLSGLLKQGNVALVFYRSASW